MTTRQNLEEHFPRCPRQPAGEDQLNHSESDKEDDEDKALGDPRCLRPGRHPPESQGVAQVGKAEAAFQACHNQ